METRTAQCAAWSFLCVLLSSAIYAVSVSAFQWEPTEEQLIKYRRSWNPLSHGPLLQTSPDVHPVGQLHVRPYVFGQVTEHSFGNQFVFATERKPGPLHLYSVQEPWFQAAYGVTDNFEVGIATALQSFWARENGKVTTDTGLGDTSAYFKWRFRVQDPETWQPTITFFSQMSTPTGKWIGEEIGQRKPPGGFAPVGRFPSTRAGEIGFTEGLIFRKNIKPFRLSGGVYYTYATPGRDGPKNTYFGDLFNSRLVFEHILSDKYGFGYNLEFATLHGFTWRLDGHEINAGQKSGFSSIGIEPAIQWRFGETYNIVGAAGVLFTVAGQNAAAGMFPNFSIYYFYRTKGRPVLMR